MLTKFHVFTMKIKAHFYPENSVIYRKIKIFCGPGVRNYFEFFFEFWYIFLIWTQEQPIKFSDLNYENSGGLP